MSDDPGNHGNEASGTALAEDRTHLAEDRTLLANERTFAGWTRTAMASIGVGLGLNALFARLDPAWAPKAITTLFMLLGVLIIVVAERRATDVVRRLDAHKVDMLRPINLRIIAVVHAVGTAALVAAIWLL